MIESNVLLSPAELYLCYAMPLTFLFALLGSYAMKKTNKKKIILPKIVPQWIFGPVWAALYILMSFSFWIVRMHYGDSDASIHREYIYYYVLCAVLAFWTWIYFAMKRYILSIIWILGCLGLSILTCWKFFELDLIAGWLLVPLCVWVAFASILNILTAHKELSKLKTIHITKQPVVSVNDSSDWDCD